MAENTYKSNTFKKPEKEKKSKSSKSKSRFSFDFFKDPRFSLALGFFLLITSLYLFIAFLSYLFTGKADQSVILAFFDTSLAESGQEVDNWLGLYGAITSHYLIYQWLGISAFFIPPLLFFLGFKLVFKRELVSLFSAFILSVFAGLWLSLLLGYITHSISGVTEIGFLSGGLGFELAKISTGLFGWGTFLILALSLFIFIIYYFNITAINAFQVKDPKPMGNEALVADEPELKPTYSDDRDNWPEQKTTEEIPEPVLVTQLPVEEPVTNQLSLDVTPKPSKEVVDQPLFTVEETKDDTEELAEQLVEAQGVYDPTLDLSNYKLPPIELLNEYEPSKVQVTAEELNQNKDRILSTLTNFKIGIQSIKAMQRGKSYNIEPAKRDTHDYYYLVCFVPEHLL